MITSVFSAAALVLLQPAAVVATESEPETILNEGDEELLDEELYGDGDDYDDIDPSTLKRLFVRDSQEATEIEVDHPMQEICMRKIMPGSRVKARMICQDKTSWVAYRIALDAMTDSWGRAATALEPGGDPTPGKSFGMGR